jgi:hypothetical protein
MSQCQSPNATHNNTVSVLEGARQASVAAAATQAAVTTAEIVFLRACLASALANGVSTSNYVYGLKQLGTGGY